MKSASTMNYKRRSGNGRSEWVLGPGQGREGGQKITVVNPTENAINPSNEEPPFIIRPSIHPSPFPSSPFLPPLLEWQRN
ncbi:hypothetical protein VTJ04DRAFT_9786 [Mycothermus thermophilus]|uniref:uncharacterized protein n=1 Tax=Humicola insolens TaxID=85995 RepID=UPI0037430DFD